RGLALTLESKGRRILRCSRGPVWDTALTVVLGVGLAGRRLPPPTLQVIGRRRGPADRLLRQHRQNGKHEGLGLPGARARRDDAGVPRLHASPEHLGLMLV